MKLYLPSAKNPTKLNNLKVPLKTSCNLYSKGLFDVVKFPSSSSSERLAYAPRET